MHLHPNQHAGYFPGATQIHMVVHFRARDGLLLGAQAVGPDGVDKRIDILATAIRNQMGIAALIDLDLAYSPPYGQAKDPVNLTGMAGENVLSGTVRLWYAHELEDVMASSRARCPHTDRVRQRAPARRVQHSPHRSCAKDSTTSRRPPPVNRSG